MNPQLRYCLNLQNRHLVGTMKRCRENWINMFPPSCDGETTEVSAVGSEFISPTHISRFHIHHNTQSIDLNNRRTKSPKFKTWILTQSAPQVTYQSPNQLGKLPNSSLEHRMVSPRGKIYDQELPVHPRADPEMMYSYLRRWRETRFTVRFLKVYLYPTSLRRLTYFRKRRI